jgi:hypothetical protein
LKPPVLWRGDPDGDPAKTSRRFLAEVFHPAQGAWPPWRIKAWVVRHPGREALWPEYVAEDGLVNRWSAVPTNRRVYSAPNRGRGEIVRRGRYEEGVEVYRGDVRPRVIPRLTGERRHAIHHGPIPQGWWRQPTALAPDRFPTDRFFSLVFRQVYDRLGRDRVPRTADWDSLGLLRQAVHTMESKLEQALWELAARHLTSRGTTLPQFWPTPSPMAPPDPPPRRVDRAIYNKRLTEEPQ